MRMFCFCLAAISVFGQSPVGIFLGELNGGMGGKLRLGLEVKQAADGKLAGEMTSVDQGYAKLLASSVVIEGKTLKMAFGVINASYEGTLDRKSVV